MRREIKQGFALYWFAMVAMAVIYMGLQSTAWGRHIWEILSTQPSNWHI